jgi:hypothetical protein
MAIVPPSSAQQMAKWALDIAGVFTLVVGLFWAVWIVRAVRRDLARHRNGLCMKCGYDLRHCLDRCSECGEPMRET